MDLWWTQLLLFITFLYKTGKWRLIEFPQVVDPVTDQSGQSEEMISDEIENFEQGIVYQELVLVEATGQGWKYEVSRDKNSLCFFHTDYHPENGIFVAKAVILFKDMAARFSVDGKRYQAHKGKIKTWTQLKKLILGLDELQLEPVQAVDVVNNFHSGTAILMTCK